MLTIHTSAIALRLLLLLLLLLLWCDNRLLRLRQVCRCRLGEVDIVKVVKVEEFGVGQEIQIISQATKVILLAGQVLWAGNGIQIGQVLRHIRCPSTASETRHVRNRYARLRRRQWRANMGGWCL